MRMPRPAYSTPDGVPSGTPGAPPPSSAAPPAPTPPAPAPVLPPGVAPPPPAAPPAEIVIAPWKQGELYKLGEGDKAKPWWSAVPEEPVRQLLETKQYKTPAELAAAYYSLNKLQNGAPDVLALPGKDATPEQITAFDKAVREKKGVPEAPDKYELQLGEKPDPKFVDFGTKMLHKIGASPKEAQEFVNEWNNFVGQQSADALAAEQAANEAEVTALETKYGPRLTELQTAGGRVVQALGLDQQMVDKLQDKVGYGAVMELFIALGTKITEGNSSWLKGGPTPPVNANDPSTMTPQAAQARITQLQGDADFQAKYTGKNHPEHAWAVQQMEALHKKVLEKPTA